MMAPKRWPLLSLIGGSRWHFRREGQRANLCYGFHDNVGSYGRVKLVVLTNQQAREKGAEQ